MTTYSKLRFGDYQLIQHIGSGGFAEVYLGEHTHLGTQAAVKVLKGNFTSEEVEGKVVYECNALQLMWFGCNVHRQIDIPYSPLWAFSWLSRDK